MTTPCRVLVTGASGFLGGHLCRALTLAGATVRGLARDIHAVPAGCEAFEVVEGNRQSFVAACSGVNAVVHCAGRAHVIRESEADPLAAFRRANVCFTRELLDACTIAGVSRVVFLSSVAALGRPDNGVLTSETPTRPATPYGVSKLEAELLVAEWTRTTGMASVTLRPPMVYGPGMKGNPLRLFRALARGIPLPLASIENQRSLLFVENLVAAIRLLLEIPLTGHQTYLVADAESVSTPELVRFIAQGLGRRARLVPAPLGLLRLCARVGDLGALLGLIGSTSEAFARLTESLVLDTSDLTAATGFTPPVEVEEGIALTARSFLGGGP
mgnify:CR=1 FL=1